MLLFLAVPYYSRFEINVTKRELGSYQPTGNPPLVKLKGLVHLPKFPLFFCCDVFVCTRGTFISFLLCLFSFLGTKVTREGFVFQPPFLYTALIAFQNMPTSPKNPPTLCLDLFSQHNAVPLPSRTRKYRPFDTCTKGTFILQFFLSVFLAIFIFIHFFVFLVPYG